jgi:hypothetical protein
MEEIEKQMDLLKAQINATNNRMPDNKLSLIVFSGDLDKALAAFVIATGAVAMGMEAIMFFTFWGTPLFERQKQEGRW